MRLTTLFLILATAGGCTMPAADDQLRDRDWELVSIEGFDSLPSGVSTPTIRFGSDGRLSGNTACNRASAGYSAEGDRLTINALATTKRACLDPQGNALERAYVAAVEATRAYRITDGQLELLDASGKVLARFR
ncbi:MAG TPA: META domain-containing protein [Thermoanaerobaculia bacterium]|nr:META domain-containing protein [Thermoanaerobaculia bacterium]